MEATQTEKTDEQPTHQSRNLIGGEWVGAALGHELAVVNPATDKVIARVPWGGQEEAELAIQAAAEALGSWRSQPALERARFVRSIGDLMLSAQDDLARLITLEQGKPVAEAKAEIRYAASFLDWASEEAKRVYGDIVPASDAKKRILVLRQPVGVATCITPWNFPAAMITRKIGPALAAGCTVVVKPAEQTPLTAIAIAELSEQAGLPAGVLNVITGDADAIGSAFLADARVRKLSFTGSTEVGKLLMRKAAANLTRLSLELGGHAPFIVFDDADVTAAVAGTMASKFRNMGQTCLAPNRFLIQSGVYDQFVEKLEAAMDELKLGPGDEPGVAIGPLIDDAAVHKVTEHVEDALIKGATLRAGGKVISPRTGLAKRFYLPTILEGATSDMLLSREETFGPIVALRRFSDEDEAVQLANDSAYGLAAYFYTRDATRLIRVAERLHYGIIGANDGAPSTAQAPFGGIKASGFGREGGKYAMEEYLDAKYVCWGL